MTKDKADIIIIGGGLLGCATAYQLAKRKGGRILLYERFDIASQASSRAAGLVTRTRSSIELMKLVQETYDCIEFIESELKEPLGLQQTGSITIGASEISDKNVANYAGAADSFGIPYELLDAKEVGSLLPWMNIDSVTSSIHIPTDAFIDSAQLCNGYAKMAKKMGVTIRSRTEVKEILFDNTGIQGVRLANGDKITAPIVINAAGSWANLLSYPLGIGLPMSPVRSHFWITEANHKLFPAKQPFAIIPDANAFTRPDVGGLIIGIREPNCIAYDPRKLPSSVEDADFSADNGWETLSEGADGFAPFFSDIRDTGIAHYIAGPSCYVPDAMFVVGAIGEISGLYAATGCCGAGVAAGAGIGRVVAEQVLGENTFVDAAYFDPLRFGKINPFDAVFQQRCADARSQKKSG